MSLPRVASPGYLSQFLYPGLPCVAAYCAPSGVRVVSKVPRRPYPELEKASLSQRAALIRLLYSGRYVGLTKELSS
jgi:hypothetical protein